jgi:serine/threonine protein kinase
MALRREVEALLAHDMSSADFLDAPALSVAAQVITMDPGPLTPGQHIGTYTILSHLATGGMGEVYRAHDTKLNRDVALKVLPGSSAYDPDRLARFKREAHVLASLNHPNIAAVYGFEDGEGVQALALELIDGDTLAERISRGPMLLDEVLPIAKQLADALEAAHEKGIVHRDLKPANIKVRPDGTVKVLDFGIARLVLSDASGRAEDPLTSPAMRTESGTILGTPAYMAPEQARGQAVDVRADIWAFGCVLFETLAAVPVFKGDTRTDTMAAVVGKEPGWEALPPGAAAIRPLLARCLKKNPKQRLQAIGDAPSRLKS